MLKNNKKFFALLLSLIMIVYCLPINIFAIDVETTDVIVEEESLREENVKHFKMPDGSYTAVVYNNPVHRKDSNGVWQDIDNRMNESTVKNKQAYVTSDGRAVFSKKINNDDPTVFELSENGYSIKVSFDNSNIKNTTAKLSNHATKYVPTGNDDIETQYKKLKTIDNNTTISYKNLLKGMTLEYVLSANDVKENIIIEKAQDAYDYSFTYELVGLVALLNEDGSINLLDENTQEPVCQIPAPYMYDAEGENSYDVSYTLTDLENGRYALTVSANSEWINDAERSFPVVIDPTMTFTAGIWDTYINAADTDANYGSSEELWVSSTKTTLIKFGDVPSIAKNAKITYASLNAYYYYYVTTGSLDIGLYQVGFNWDEWTLTWDDANQYYNLGIVPFCYRTATVPASPSITEDTPGMVSFNVTELVQAWYAGLENYGMALKYEGGSNGSVIIKSWEAGSSTRSYYEVTYVLEDLPVDNGTYFIRNGELCRYIQINDNTSDYNVDGQTMELWPLDGATDQKWEVEYLHNGYYKIVSALHQKAISVPSGETTTNNISLELEDYEALDRQQWKITTASGGMLKLSPRTSSTRYMAASSGIGANGRNVEQRANQSGNLLDEWYFAEMLPLSGSEIAYEPSRWSGTVQSRTNCYAYAINNQLDKSGGLWVPKDNFLYQQPGQYAGNTIYQSDITTAGDLIVNAVEDDFDEYNSYNNADLVFIEIDKYDRCPTGSYKVALVVNPGVDYHWYRQDADGYWSHKQGGNAISRYDNSNNLIIDPEIADRGGYSEFIGFYAVMPWNDYYTSRMLTPGIESLETETNTVVVNTELVQQITVGMTFEEVKTILGSSGVNVGSGFIIYQYELTNNQTAYINYVLNESSELVVCNVVIK